MRGEREASPVSTAFPAAKVLAEFLVSILGALGSLPMLEAFFWITVLLTQPLSNAAAALLVLPTAINTAGLLGTNARMFAMMVSVAASISLITPFEPACLLVHGPGKYQFLDLSKTAPDHAPGVWFLPRRHSMVLAAIANASVGENLRRSAG